MEKLKLIKKTEYVRMKALCNKYERVRRKQKKAHVVKPKSSVKSSHPSKA